MFTPSSTPPTLRVGLYRTSSIGDVVLASACMNLLAQLNHPYEVTWVGRSPSIDLLKAAYPEMKVVALEGKDAKTSLKRVCSQLSHLHFLLDLQGNLRSRYIGGMLKSEYKIPVYTCHKHALGRGSFVMAARLRGRGRLLPERYLQAKTLQYEMMALSLRQALEKQLPVEMLDTIAGYSPVPSLPTRHDPGEQLWQKELKFGLWLAVAPGAAHEAKRAPLELTEQILQKVRVRLQNDGQVKGVGLLFLGDERDREVVRGLTDALQWPYAVLNLAGKLSLWESALAVREAKCLLTNDSSLLHIAEAVGVPVASLFGPTVEGFGFAPWRPDSQSFSLRLGCRPCSKHGKVLCRYGDQKCFYDLPKRDIAEFLCSRLKPYGSQA